MRDGWASGAMTPAEIDKLVKQADAHKDILRDAYDVIREALAKEGKPQPYEQITWIVAQSRKRIRRKETE